MKQLLLFFTIVLTFFAGFAQTPETGTLTFTTTDLGTQTIQATDNVYDLGEIESTDNLTYLAFEVIDDNINTSNVNVFYESGVLGQMIYSGSNNLWIFSPTAPFSWEVGVNTMTAQFVDLDNNTLDVSVEFTYVIPGAPETGILTFITDDLGNQTRTAIDNVYDLGEIESTDNLTYLAFEILDDNINTNTTNVYYNSSILGNMIYSGSNNLWIFNPTAPFSWDEGVNTMTTQFVDLDDNTLDVSVEFTYIQMYGIDYEVINGNGTMSASDGTNPLESGAVLQSGTTVIFTAEADDNYEVKEWTINSEIVEGNTTNTLNIESLSDNMSVTVEFQSSVNVNDISDNILKIYPNPTRDIIKFSENIDFELYNTEGKLVISDKNANNCDLENLKSGIYILKTKNIEQKIIKK